VVGGENHHGAFIDTWADDKWTTRQAPLPGHPESSDVDTADLVAVSCAATGYCASVGSYALNDHPGAVPIVETESAGHWAVSRATLPPGDSAGQPLLRSVSCAATDACVAVGTYETGDFQPRGLIDSLSDGHWTPTAAPAASDNVSPAALDQVSCATQTFCTALGSRAPKGNDFTTLSDGAWTTVHAPSVVPASANIWTMFVGVSCTAPGDCVAVGNAESDSYPHRTTVIDSLANSSWSTMTGPVPRNTQLQPTLNSITDMPGGGYLAVGDYYAYDDTTRPLLDSRG
jgi:hypothetical protein